MLNVPEILRLDDPYVRHKHKHKRIGVRAVGGGEWGQLPTLKFLEYHIIWATNLQRFGQKELQNLARLMKITIISSSLFPDQA